MSCVHLQQLYTLCEKEGIKLSSSDLIHMVCNQCGKQEVCPTAMVEFPEDSADASKPADKAE